MRRNPLLGAVVAALLPFLLAACGGEEEPEAEVVEAPAGAPGATPPPASAVADPGDLPPGVTMAMVEEGRELYGTVCMACHGPDGAGTAIGPALTDAEWINVTRNFDEIVNLIHTGVPDPQQFPGPMLPMGGGTFTDEQVRALAAYVWAISHQG